MTFVYTKLFYIDIRRVGVSQGMTRKVDIVILGHFR